MGRRAILYIRQGRGDAIAVAREDAEAIAPFPLPTGIVHLAEVPTEIRLVCDFKEPHFPVGPSAE
jgi:hypothetical protein